VRNRTILCAPLTTGAARALVSSGALANGKEFKSWEQALRFAATLDPDKLTLQLKIDSKIEPAAARKAIDSDFFGKQVNGIRLPGPFADVRNGPAESSIDPR